MLIAPPYGLNGPRFYVSKELSAFADQFILYGSYKYVKTFLHKKENFRILFSKNMAVKGRAFQRALTLFTDRRP